MPRWVALGFGTLLIVKSSKDRSALSVRLGVAFAVAWLFTMASCTSNDDPHGKSGGGGESSSSGGGGGGGGGSEPAIGMTGTFVSAAVSGEAKGIALSGQMRWNAAVTGDANGIHLDAVLR